MIQGRRDLAMGALFFLGMAAFGTLILWAGRHKWQPELAREQARHDTYQSDATASEGLQQLAYARRAEGEARLRHATDAVALLTRAIDLRPDRADLYTARAEAHQMKGDGAAAQADLERAKALKQAPGP